MKKVAVVISPNYKDYAKKYLATCLSSLRSQTFIDFDLYLIDNETSEESFAFLRQEAPEAIIKRLNDNNGFAGGNNAALHEIIEKNYEYAVLFNMDTEIEPKALESLVKAMDSEVKAGAIQAALVLHPDRHLLNSVGNISHFLGFGYCLGYREPLSTLPKDVCDIFYPSGAAVILRVKALREVGLFDEEMWMYNEDEDLGWRLWLRGWTCRLEPKALVFHNYEFARSVKKYYWMDRNRLITIFKNYHCLTIVLIIPALVLMEFGLGLFALKSGWWREKLRVWAYFLSPKTWRYLIKARRAIQKTRLVKDREIIKMISGHIWYQEIDDWKLRMINPFFALYWRLVKFLIRW